MVEMGIALAKHQSLHGSETQWCRGIPAAHREGEFSKQMLSDKAPESCCLLS